MKDNTGTQLLNRTLQSTRSHKLITDVTFSLTYGKGEVRWEYEVGRHAATGKWKKPDLQ